MLLAGLLAGAHALARKLAINKDADSESFLVVGAFFTEHFIDWRKTFLALYQFLQAGLRVHPRATGQNVFEGYQQIFSDKFLGDLVALVEIEGADNSFKAVSEDLGTGTISTALFATA